jgi:general secretion pathway protein G
MYSRKTNRRIGFTLLEVMLVVVILGLVAAIALPKLSQGATNTSATALASDLAVMRTAIDLYQNDHNGTFPTAANIANQLIEYSDITGATLSTTKNATSCYGPYLRSVPTLPVGAEKGNTTFAAATGTGVGWVYDGAGNLIAGTVGTELDSNGKAYNTY